MRRTKHLPSLCSCLNDSTTFVDQFRNLLILVWKQTQRESDIVPLSFVLSTRQPGRQFACELLGVFILFKVVSESRSISTAPTARTFSINPAKNLMIRRKLSSSNASSADNKLNMSTK